MSTSFIIMRRETISGYSTRGPIAQPVSLKDAQSEIVRLKKLFPYQDFVIMGEIGGVSRSDRVTVKIDAPDLTDAPPKKRRAARKAPPPPPMLTPAESWNVVQLRQEEIA
jgi:hypothetical protein